MLDVDEVVEDQGLKVFGLLGGAVDNEAINAGFESDQTLFEILGSQFLPSINRVVSVTKQSHEDPCVIFEEIFLKQAKLTNRLDRKKKVVSVLGFLKSWLDQSNTDVNQVFIVDVRSVELQECDT